MKRVIESAQKWMGRYDMKAEDSEYKGYDRRLTEKFINGLDDRIIIEEIIRELTALEIPVRSAATKY